MLTTTYSQPAKFGARRASYPAASSTITGDDRTDGAEPRVFHRIAVSGEATVKTPPLQTAGRGCGSILDS